MEKFKSGDLVRVKETLIPWQIYPMHQWAMFIEQMQKYVGWIFQVESKEKDLYLWQNMTLSWIPYRWTDDMLEKVDLPNNYRENETK